MGDTIGGLFDGGFFQPKQQAQKNYSDDDREAFINPLRGKVANLGQNFNYGDVQKAFGTPNVGKDLEGQAVSILQGFNPQSLLQGSQGALGSAQGMFADASGKVGSDPFGASNFFQRALDPNFADPTKNPQVQGVLDAIVNQGQRGFNIGADKIAGSANAASGGVGQGSAKTDALSRLGADISSQVADQSANVLLGEGARLQGVQQSAAQQALGEGNRQAELMSQIAQSLGGLGINQGSMGMDATKGLADLGQRFSSRELQGALFPLMQQYELGNMLKTGTIPGKSGFQQSQEMAEQAGAVLGAIFSDERVKHDIDAASNEMDAFVKELQPYSFKYDFEPEVQRYGVMAQDLEKSKVGKSLVKENQYGVKMVDTNQAVGVILAALARIEDRLSKLEVANAN